MTSRKPYSLPEWVAELNSVGANHGSPVGLVTLDEASLLDAAKTETGLDDFGDDEWRESPGRPGL